MRTFLLVVMLGCASSPPPAAAPMPPPPEPAANAPAPEPPPPPPPAPAPATQVAVNSGDPCEGGEVIGSKGDSGAGGLGLRGGAGGGGAGAGMGAGVGGMAPNNHNRPPKLKGGSPTVSGNLDKAIIARVVRQHLNMVWFCYERELAKNPSLEGKVVVKFTIGLKGEVTTATATGINADVATCVAGVFRRLEFPAPQGGSVDVSYPFDFKAE